MKTNKGQMLGGKMLYFIVAIVVISMLFLAFINITTESQKIKVECVDPFYHEIMMAKVLTDSSCMTYYDEDTERTVVGTIDMDKYTNESLSSCFTYLDPDHIEFEIMRRFIDTKIGLTLNSNSIGSNEFNNKQTINKLVQVYNKGEIESSILEFHFEITEC
ncbi:hypothetical protein HN397_04175 [archaeon]|jgi:hypothetical protein|nr:hypothetical protein [archaeon]MBT4669799.1 hypothetical protein [archaeon]MBT7053386.1 hypothetical protein [archaeon]